jgi:hypothetical protein
MRRLLIAASLFFSACTPKEYHCVASRECVPATGGFGLCVHEHCAFADTSCTSGFRFDDSSGSEAKECVSPTLFPSDGGVADAGAHDAAAADGGGSDAAAAADAGTHD